VFTGRIASWLQPESGGDAAGIDEARAWYEGGDGG
jgi:hypothetical protein